MCKLLVKKMELRGVSFTLLDDLGPRKPTGSLALLASSRRLRSAVRAVSVALQPLLRGERRLAGGRRAPHHPLDGRANRQEPLSDLHSLVIPRRTSDQRMAELLHQLAGRRQLVREPLDLRVLEEDRS